MATLTAPQLVNLRTKAHRSSLYLSVFQPATILSALVTGAPARGARAIQYNTGAGTAAQFATIENFQLVEIDTAFGTEYVRLKSITGNEVTGTITVDENGIDAANGDAIRVKHFYPMVAVPPSIRSGVFYKFYDQVYLTQNSAPPPVCIIGSHLIGVLSAGSVVFSLNSSSSYAIAQGATISSRAWSCLHNGGGAGDISFSSAVAANPTLTITAAGQYWLKCTVVDSNGKQQATWRAIFVYSTLEDAYTDFTVSSLSGDWNLGGWQASVEVNGVSTLASFPDGALAVIHYKNYFDATEGYVDLWGTASQNIVLAGYIRRDQDNDNFDDGTGKVNFDITTPDGVMDNMSELGSISLNASATVNKWWKYASWLTVGRGIHHLLKWHSSVLETCDVLGLTDNTLGVKNTDFTEPSVLQMVNGLGYQRGHFAKMVSSRLGRLYFATDSQMLNTAARAALDTVFTIATADISETVDVVRQPEAVIGVADLDGFSFNGTTSTPFISIMPGYRESAVSYGLPGFRGTSPVSAKSQVLDDQTDSNEKVGRVFAQANNNPLEMRFTTPANYLGAFDIVPSIGWYAWGIVDASLKRNTELFGKLLICRNITHQIDTQSGTIQTSVVFEPEAIGPDGIQGNYPVGYPTPSLRPPDWDEDGAASSARWLITGFSSNDDDGYLWAGNVDPLVVGSGNAYDAGIISSGVVCGLGTGRAVIVYDDGATGKIMAAVVNASNVTITSVGTPAEIATATTLYDAVALSSSLVLVTYDDDVVTLSISGDTVTPNTPTTLSVSTVEKRLVKLTSTSAVYIYDGASNIEGAILTISGTAVSEGTIYTVSNHTSNVFSITALDTQTCVICYNWSGNILASLLTNIGGDSITHADEIILFNPSTSTNPLSICKVTGTTALAVFPLTLTKYDACIVSWDGASTLSAGSLVIVTDGTNNRYIAAARLVKSGTVAVTYIYRNDANTNFIGAARTLSVAGSVVTDDANETTVRTYATASAIVYLSQTVMEN